MDERRPAPRLDPILTRAEAQGHCCVCSGRIYVGGAIYAGENEGYPVAAHAYCVDDMDPDDKGGVFGYVKGRKHEN